MSENKRRGSTSKKSVSKSDLREFVCWFVVPMGSTRPDFIALNYKTAFEMSLHPETGERYCSIHKVKVSPRLGLIKIEGVR